MSDWKLKRILCAIDLSPASQAVLGWATLLAARSGAALDILHAVTIPVPPYITPGEFAPLTAERDRSISDARNQISQLLTSVGNREARPEIIVREGHALELVRELASTTHPDLIVVGSHGHTRLERMLLGSVTENLFHETASPVLVVKRPPTDGTVRIICPVTSDRSSEHSAVIASAFAQLLGASLTVMTVIEDERAADTELCNRISGRLSGRCTVEQVVKQGSPSQAILAHSVASDTDMIAIGAVKRRLLDAFTLGSTTEQVVRHARTNVLVVPSEAEVASEPVPSVSTSRSI